MRRAPADGDVLDVGGDDEGVRPDRRREERGREVLVDDGLDPAQGAVGLPYDGYAAPARRDDDVAGGSNVSTVGVSSTSRGSGEATTRRQPRRHGPPNARRGR